MLIKSIEFQLKLRIKKGAMFGLDARIALAIFGALSVISGAALYSAIENAKTTSKITTINEVSKSVEQYLLDTGSYLPYINNIIYAGNLIKDYNSSIGWNGPYFDGESISNTFVSVKLTGIPSIDSGFMMYKQSSDSWGVGTPFIGVSPTACTSSSCYIYLQRSSSNADTILELKKLFYILDDYYDDNDGAGEGRVRAWGNFSLYIELLPIVF